MKNQKYKILFTVLIVIFAVIGLQVTFATVPNPGHLLSELECNSLFCINGTAGTVTIGGTASNPLVVNGRITSTGTPTANTDVATKGYVDAAVGGGGGGEETETVVEITSSGQWTVPAGVNFIEVILVGGGGGGGNGVVSSIHAGGGGGSGYIESTHLTVTPNETLNVVVGSGGSAGSWGGASYLTKADGKLLVWANGGGAGGNAMDYGGGGGSGRCSGGCGETYHPGCSSCTGQCGGGMCGLTAAYSGGYGGTGYGAGGGGGGATEYGHRAGGGGGGYYGATSVSVSAANGSSQTGGAGAPGIVIISY